MKPKIMKTLITYLKMILLVVLLNTPLLSFANENSILISYNEDKFVELTLNNVKSGNLLVIKDLKDVKLYEYKISNTGRIKKEFDLSTLPIGYYNIELNKDMERIVYPFQISKRRAVFIENNIINVYKPMTRIKNERILISQLSLDMSPLEVKIFIETNDDNVFFDLVHSETVEGKKQINLVYKLPNYEKGKFKVLLISKGQKFVSYF